MCTCCSLVATMTMTCCAQPQLAFAQKSCLKTRNPIKLTVRVSPLKPSHEATFRTADSSQVPDISGVNSRLPIGQPNDCNEFIQKVTPDALGSGDAFAPLQRSSGSACSPFLSNALTGPVLLRPAYLTADEHCEVLAECESLKVLPALTLYSSM